MSYETEVKTNKTFVPNVIVRLNGEYFSLRDCDSGLTVKPEYRGLVGSISINPTTIDPRRISTTITEISFSLLDKNNVITELIKDAAQAQINASVDVWIGRCGVAMDFADYFHLPVTKIRGVSRPDNRYTFSASQDSARINRAIYQTAGRVSGDIFVATTSFASKDDISLFPSSGLLSVDKELMSYAAKDDATKTFSGILRGLHGTTAVDIADDTAIALANFVEANPINIILQLLVSSGGGSAYDVLDDGVALDQSLVDITDMELVRDTYFASTTFRLTLSNIGNALSFIEDQILFPNNLRFSYSADSKLTVVLLDKPSFVEESDITDEDTLTKIPTWELNGDIVTNNLEISWDWDENLGIFNQIQTFQDAASVALYGLRDPLTFEWRGVRADLGGAALVAAFVVKFFRRLSIPMPVVSVNVQLDKSLLRVGDKTVLRTKRLPNKRGYLRFDEEMEIASVGINWQTGDVKQKLLFTSFTGVRNCYLAPSDTIVSVTSQLIAVIGAGRGTLWRAGWKVRLWNNTTMAYESDPVNEIASISTDTITFASAWSTILTTSHRFKFPDFDDAVDEQRRYCFISPTGSDFSTGQESYKITP